MLASLHLTGPGYALAVGIALLAGVICFLRLVGKEMARRQTSMQVLFEREEKKAVIEAKNRAHHAATEEMLATLANQR